MSTHTKLNIDLGLLNLRTKYDYITDLYYKIKKHDHEKILKSLKIDTEYYRKKYKSFRKKLLTIITEILIRSASTINSSTLAVKNFSAGAIVSISTNLLASIAMLITDEYISKWKIRFTKLPDCINLFTLLYEKTLRQSLVEKKIDEKETLFLKIVYNHYLVKEKKLRKILPSE